MSGQLSGVDLARVTLRAALKAARKNGIGRTAKPKPPTRSVVRRDGREPLDLGAAIGALVTERSWEVPAAGATLHECPEGQLPLTSNRGELMFRFRCGGYGMAVGCAQRRERARVRSERGIRWGSRPLPSAAA
ncbi:hypothetical protein ABT121_44475 [Streptomyces sp. NPDC001928]|uniref:hypothetical protein n=1 Tax=Streptomyces sp. NPDC001928 TaxID=3154404 RepID=UPI0033273428